MGVVDIVFLLLFNLENKFLSNFLSINYRILYVAWTRSINKISVKIYVVLFKM